MVPSFDFLNGSFNVITVFGISIGFVLLLIGLFMSKSFGNFVRYLYILLFILPLTCASGMYTYYICDFWKSFSYSNQIIEEAEYPEFILGYLTVLTCFFVVLFFIKFFVYEFVTWIKGGKKNLLDVEDGGIRCNLFFPTIIQSSIPSYIAIGIISCIVLYINNGEIPIYLCIFGIIIVLFSFNCLMDIVYSVYNEFKNDKTSCY